METILYRDIDKNKIYKLKWNSKYDNQNIKVEINVKQRK